MPFHLATAESTDLFVGSAEAPRQVLRVSLSRTLTEPIPLVVRGDGVRGEGSVPAGVGVVNVEVGLELPDRRPGTRVPVTVAAGGTSLDATVTVERPGYTVHLVSHVREGASGKSRHPALVVSPEWTGDTPERPGEPSGFALLDTHVELALSDRDYRFVLAELDTLKAYLDTYPQRWADLRPLVDDGRVELVAAMDTGAGTAHATAETTIRGIADSIGYHRDILGGDPVTAWLVDVVRPDPQFPGYLADAGLTNSVWRRGLSDPEGVQHQLVGVRTPDDSAAAPSEFEWISPSGHGVLTHAMPGDHSATWWLYSVTTLADAEQAVYAMYRILRPAAVTRHLLLPVGADGTPPNRWVTAVHRSWNAKYVWPRFVCSTPRAFFTGVRGELAADGRRPSPQSRDPHAADRAPAAPCIGASQAQRAAEVAVTDAEKLAAACALLGLRRHPASGLDAVWRLLGSAAGPDTVSDPAADQAYIDLLGVCREAYDRASRVRDAALDVLVDRIDTSGEGAAVVVANTLSFDRSDLVRVPDCPAGRVVDDCGNPVPAARDRGTLVFRADDVPASGWRTYRLRTGHPTPRAWSAALGRTVTNERYEVTADPARGGGLTSIVDLASGRKLVPAGAVANELVLSDAGDIASRVVGSGTTTAVTRRETGPLGERLLISGEVDGLGYEQTVTLWSGLDRVDLRTRVLDDAGAATVLGVRVPIDLPGAVPLSGAPATGWFGLGAAARMSLVDPKGRPLGDLALGVAEVVVGQPDAAASARDLVVALARAGVPATTSSAPASWHAGRTAGSHRPDFRIVLGGPEENPLAGELLANAEPGYVAEHDRQLASSGQVLLWVPADQPRSRARRRDADPGDGGVPALLVVGPVDDLVADLGDAVVEAVGLEPPNQPPASGTVAVLTYGLHAFAADPEPALHLFHLLGGAHEFAYALVSGGDDWRALGLPARAQEYATPLLPRLVVRGPASGDRTRDSGDALPATHSFVRLEPARDVLLTRFKSTESPISPGAEAPADSVTLRLTETTGLGQRAEIGGPLRLRDLRRADLLEFPAEPTPPTLDLTGFEVATLVARPDRVVRQPSGDLERGAGQEMGAVRDPGRPSYARSWQYQRAASPVAGVTVTISPAVARAVGNAPLALEVVVAGRFRDTETSGVATLRTPAGWRIEPARMTYDLGPAGHARFTVFVTPAQDAADGLAFVSVRIDHAGSMVEDVATVVVGALTVAGQDTGLLVDVVKPEVVLRPGGRSALGVVLTNQTRDEIRGELRLVSPWETWPAVPHPVRDFAVDAGAEAEVEFPVGIPAATDPGVWWAIVKVMWFGRCQYSPQVRLVVAE